jgi:hypothetical protein
VISTEYETFSPTVAYSGRKCFTLTLSRKGLRLRPAETQRTEKLMVIIWYRVVLNIFSPKINVRIKMAIIRTPAGVICRFS